jgi:pimeloyl-ACP methyl ester carboxylesterase
VIEMSSNERLSYDMILARARSMAEERTLRQLERLGPPPYRNPRQWGIKQQAAEKVDVAYGRIVGGMMGMMLYSPAYAIRDLFNLLAGAIFCMQKLYTQWMTFDARKLGMVFHTPIFIIQGASDVMTPTALAATWLDEIEAPQKALVSIEEGGHLVFVTAAATYLAELLTRIRPLAVVSSGTQHQAADEPSVRELPPLARSEIAAADLNAASRDELPG